MEEQTPHAIGGLVHHLQCSVAIKFQTARPAAQSEHIMFAQAFYVANLEGGLLCITQRHVDGYHFAIRKDVATYESRTCRLRISRTPGDAVVKKNSARA